MALEQPVDPRTGRALERVMPPSELPRLERPVVNARPADESSRSAALENDRKDLEAVYGSENIPPEPANLSSAGPAADPSSMAPAPDPASVDPASTDAGKGPREPAAEFPQPATEIQAPGIAIVGVEDHETLRAEGTGAAPLIGQVFALRSKSAEPGIIGFAEVISVNPVGPGRYQLRAKVLRLSQHFLVQNGDQLLQLDLRTSQPLYQGHTEMLIRDRWKDVSSRFRPLYIQGFSIGETAAVLGKDEVMVSVFGHLSYGLFERVSIGTFLPGYFLKSANGNMKVRMFQNNSDTVSLGTSFTKTKDSDMTAVNLTLYWDAVTSDHMISHTLATFAVATLQNVEDTVAIKTAGTSSLQTGYEALLNNWDRVLFGPSYNFETKSIGGYLAYKRIWDHFHLSGSLSTVDVRQLKFDPKTGYVALVEGYWRF